MLRRVFREQSAGGAELGSASSPLWQFVLAMQKCESGFGVVLFGAQAVVSVMMNLSVMFFCLVMIALPCPVLPYPVHTLTHSSFAYVSARIANLQMVWQLPLLPVPILIPPNPSKLPHRRGVSVVAREGDAA